MLALRNAIAWRVRVATVAFAASIALVSVASAQAQAAFDGNYAGNATLTGCTGQGVNSSDRNLRMTITSSRVTVHDVRPDGGPGLTFSGTVDPQGKVSASAQFVASTGRPVYLTLWATINGNNLSGTVDGTRCHWNLSMAKR